MDGCLSVHVNVKALQVTLSKCNHFKFKVPKKTEHAKKHPGKEGVASLTSHRKYFQKTIQREVFF